MEFIGKTDKQGIAEDGPRLIETDSVLGAIATSFLFVPVKYQFHARIIAPTPTLNAHNGGW
jgi:hypothetical protein